MTDPSVGLNGRAVLRAVRFPTTVGALAALGVPKALFMPAGYLVVVDAGRVILQGRRQGTAILNMPASAVRSVSIGETRSRPLYPQVALAIFLKVKTGGADVDLPVVPISDDGKRSLTWNDAEVQNLAERLRKAIERESSDSKSTRDV